MNESGRKFSAGIEIQPIDGPGAPDDLLALARRVYQDDPCWVQPLRIDRKNLWDPRNPWFQHGRARAWLAVRDTRPVGSISAQIDDLHEKLHGEHVGYFGQLEAVDDPAVFAALLDTAVTWLHEQGMTEMRGPFDLSINQSCGLLIEGFESPPMIMMGHAPRYYRRHLEASGMVKAVDLLAYRLHPDFDPPRVMGRALARLGDRIRLRTLSRRGYADDIELVRELFNDAWADNWGFIPFTREEFQRVGVELRRIVGPDYVQIAELDGTAAGFIAALPNLNELIADLDGRLLPLGWLRLLWRLKRRSYTTARVPLLGIRRSLQHGLPGAALAFKMIDTVRRPLVRDGVSMVELSWILENNRPMRAMIEALGADAYKRYRIYRRPLQRNMA